MGGSNGAEDTGDKGTKAGTEVGHSFQCGGMEGRSQPLRLQVGGGGCYLLRRRGEVVRWVRGGLAEV